MRELLALAVSIALPWLAGALAAAALWRNAGEGRGLVCIGYGYVIGALATTLLMRIMSVAGWRWNFVALAGAPVVLAAVAAYLARPFPIVRSADHNEELFCRPIEYQ